MQKGGLVSIILVNYNGKQFNQACIESLLAQTYQNFEIIFVDNASSDGSLEEVEKIFHDKIIEGIIRIVPAGFNAGFAEGNNIGHRNASKTSEFVCLLNNDTTVPSDWLIKLIQAINNDDHLGGVASIILDRGYEDSIKNTVFNDKKIFISTYLGETALSSIPKDQFQRNIAYTSGLSGCCFLYKKNILSKPFPTSYFAYGEDVFLSFLILKKGYKLAYVLDSFVSHFGSGSFGKKPSFFKLFHGTKNQIVNFLIFYSPITYLRLLPLFLFKELSHLLLNSPILRLKAKLFARFRVIKNYREILTLRKYIKHECKVTEKYFLAQLSYKLTDDLYYNPASRYFSRAIKIVNFLFFTYSRILLLPSRK
ncbi:MAG TPA: glycosyltransferase family 2 protein [Candidatus Absconditabacterales bacterium]|nr:glycosyltransferase family 2 protein [Candidatus Absconditabacterales bacterium]